MTKFLLSILVLGAFTASLCHASLDKSGLSQQKRDGALHKRITEEWYRAKRQSGTMNWDLNQMFDLFQKVSGGMGGGAKRSVDRLKRQSGTMNWDMNQMVDLFQKVSGGMQGKRSVDT